MRFLLLPSSPRPVLLFVLLFGGVLFSFTYLGLYLTRTDLLSIPYFIAGIGLTIYAIVGNDPGYGTLAFMVVFMCVLSERERER